jgi:hypothetical protein
MPTVGAANTSVLLVGTNLTTATVVRFNGVTALTTSPNASVTTALRAVVPLDATTGPITVTNEAGTDEKRSAPTAVIAAAPAHAGGMCRIAY